MTLVEVLITVALLALITGIAVTGMGLRRTAQLKQACVMVSGAIRIAYAHANAVSKPVRLVFDFDERTLSLEEASAPMLVVKGDRTGGAQAATEAEHKAVEEAEAILKGPRPPRPSFTPTKAFGFNPDAGKTSRELPSGVRFLQIETAHSDEAEVTGRAYLYFWPGGQTEHAALQLTKASSDEKDTEGDTMTVLVQPLTGKTEIKAAKVSMPRPRDDSEESERAEGM